MSSEHDVAPHAVPVARGAQVPGEVASLQLTQVPRHSLSQQTFSAPQTPLAHWLVDVHPAPAPSLT